MAILLQKTLSEVERDLKKSAPAPKAHSGARRMVIREVERAEDGSAPDGRGTREGGGGQGKTDASPLVT